MCVCVCLRRNARGLGEWVGEKKQRAIMFGCDGFRYYPLRGLLDHGDTVCTHAIGLRTHTA